MIDPTRLGTGACLVVLAALVRPAAAQDRSVLSLLDPGDRILPTDGRAVEGRLGPDDLVTESGRRVQAWRLGPVRGAVRIDLASTDFDAFLWVLGDGEVRDDDDSGGKLDARVCVEGAGPYTVVAASLSGEVGAFTLRAAPESGGACPSSLLGAKAVPNAEIGDELRQIVPEGALQLPGAVDFRFTGQEPVIQGRLLKAWSVEGAAGDRLAFTHRSPGEDTYLYLTGPGLPQPLADDDSAGELDARICLELPEDGTYVVYAAPYSADGTGAEHRLDVVRGVDAEVACGAVFSSSPGLLVERLAALDTGGRTLRPGDEIRGELTDAVRHPTAGDPIQPWRLEAEEGATVWVDVVSEDFDATVRAVWPGLDEERMNDDSGGGCNSRLEVVMPREGPVIILPGAFSGAGRGRFLLRASTDPGPLEGGGCGGGEVVGSAEARDAAWEVVGRYREPEEELRVGSEVEVRLSAATTTVVRGIRVRGWRLPVEGAGDLIVEALSEDLDAVLYLQGPSGGAPLFDDDAAGALDARVEVLGAPPGDWLVVVGTPDQGEGTVRIRVLRRVGG
ncbi:MAG: PPC domain-containing protein [Gemmatimonadota bacterium]